MTPEITIGLVISLTLISIAFCIAFTLYGAIETARSMVLLTKYQLPQYEYNDNVVDVIFKITGLGIWWYFIPHLLIELIAITPFYR
jgi:hypothetical protein